MPFLQKKSTFIFPHFRTLCPPLSPFLTPLARSLQLIASIIPLNIRQRTADP